MKIFFKNWDFRQQLVMVFVVGVVVLAGVTSFSLASISNERIRSQLLEEGLNLSESFADQSRLALLYGSSDNAQDAIRATKAFPNVSSVGIYYPDGSALLDENGFSRLFASDNLLATASQGVTRVDEGENTWVFFAPVFSGGNGEDDLLFGDEVVTTELLGFVAVVLDKKALTELSAEIFEKNLTVSAVIGILILILLILLSNKITGPLKELSGIMARADQGENKLRSRIYGPTDITHMQKSFNRMMGILEKREIELTKAKDTAIESARIKGEFAANVSHELRTPMNAVLGMLDLLKTLGLTSKQLEYVKTAKISGEVLLDLIDDVLDFSKVDIGEIIVHNEEVFIEDLLEEVVGLLANQAASKHIDLGYVCSGSVPQRVMLDSIRIRQILINLLGNAIKFTSRGEISIRLKAESSAEGHFCLKFEVTDTGIGIPIAVQGRIFEAFTQADSSTTRKFGGTGLGLAISRKIVTLLGGEIGLKSQPGQGSCFWFTVPVLECDILTQNTSSDTPSGFDSLNVLCINNGDIIEEFLHESFNLWGIKNTQLKDPLKGLELLRNRHKTDDNYNVVIFDEDLQGINGVDFVKLLLSDIARHPLQILIVTSPWSTNKALYPQGVLQLAKPLRSGVLFECLRGVVGERTYVGASEEEVFHTQKGKRVLVVDDNRANQQVAVGMLERIGCETKVADTGKVAIDLIARRHFDLVLMDCQMPEMDGYEATRHIRHFEGDLSRIPIVAMTANNSTEEEQRCLEIGMDDYLSKPLRLKALQEKLDSWLGVVIEDDSPDSELHRIQSRLDQMSTFDPAVLNELRETIGEVVDSMIEAFLEDTPVYLQAIKNALAQNNTQKIRELAHTIKGSASNFGAERVVELSKSLEKIGASGDLGAASTLIPVLFAAFDELRKELRLVFVEFGNTDSVSSLMQKHTILIADDDRSMRMALGSALSSSEHQLEEVADGAHAVAICERKMPDMILIDAMMPNVDGFAACQRIRALPNGDDVPILMITALDDDESIGRAFEVGATDYIPKPVHFSVLQQRVARLLQASKAEKHVKKLAYHDPLTGLPNRSMLMQQLRVMVNRAALNEDMVAVLFLDLDRFKMINDSLGHSAGDLLLKAVADRIRGCLREQDFVARLGGDEFTVVLEGINSPDIAANIAQKICTSLSKPFAFLQQKMFVTTSVGIGLFPKDGEDIGDLLKHADSAMFSAKKKGNTFCFYEEGMEDEVAKRLELERELRHAFDNDEMLLFYQPQIDAKTDQVVSAEALIRWQHPRLGLVFPDMFISLAEESNLIDKLGAWVMEKACQQVRHWIDKGRPLRLAINVSGREFQSGTLGIKLKTLFEKYQIPANLLELEITESMLLENHERLAEDLNLIRELGVAIAIDDFGSGYSSLNYLKNLPVDILKIDRVFVENIEFDKAGQSVVGGVIALANSLQLKTVVEGVEHEGQIQIIKDLGCDYLQGYVYSKALPSQEFDEIYIDNIAELPL